MPNGTLDGLALRQAMAQLDGWTLDPACNRIQKSWDFDHFRTAIQFFDQVAGLAELHDHHPECLSVYTHLQIRLWTHDVGGLTLQDMVLAAAIDQLVARDFANALKTPRA